VSAGKREGATRELPLFPLGTVLFPGGLLPLKIFEQRYLEMTKACLRDSTPFGVCLIREGREVGDPATPHATGCIAMVEQWDMPHPGMFHLLARGGERFRVEDAHADGSGLLRGTVTLLPPAAGCAPDEQCVQLIERVIRSVGEPNFPGPVRKDDGAWVAYRIAEMMNFPMAFKQRMLELEDIGEVYDEIKIAIKTIT
jgi:Lon protease-like protein